MTKTIIHKYGYVAVLILSMLLFISFFYGKILISPNQILFNASGDGLKNYYVPMMQLGSDHYFVFEYFNYPYGEHFFYTDGFPLLVLLLKPLAFIFPEISNNIPAIINFSILLSIFVCAILIYNILVRLKLPKLLSVLFSIGITLLQPQIFRITGHFSLAFCHVIPLSFWLFLMLIQADKTIKWTIFISIHNISAILFHPYLGLMAVLSTSIALIIWSLKKFSWHDWRLYFNLFFQTVFPLIFYKIIIFLTDNVVDRNTHPQGFHENTADFFSVFFPSFGPFSGYFNFMNTQLTHNWEGISYIGIFTTILFLPVFFIFLYRIFHKKEELNRWTFLIGIIISSVVFLILSMGYPFVGKYYDTYQKIPFLREFRALGRFAWVFYYSSTIFLAVGLWSCCESWLKKVWMKYFVMAIICIIPLSYVYESYSLHNTIAATITKNKNCFLEKNIPGDVLSTIHEAKKYDFQAILPLPYFYVGTEIFDVFGTENAQKNSFFVSQQLKLPLLTNYSARSSFDISRKILRIISNKIVYKDVEKDFSDRNKPFLIVLSDKELNSYELEIVQKSTFISKCSLFSLYRINFSDLFSSFEVELPENVLEFPNKNAWFSDDTSKIICSSNFDELKSDFYFSGGGAYSGVCKLYHVLCEFPDGVLVPDSIYNASFWIYNYDNSYTFANQNLIAFINRFDTISKITNWDYPYYPIKSTLSMGLWTLVDIEFSVPDGHSKYSIVIKGNDSLNNNVYIDNLLVIKKNASVYRTYNDSLFLWNNYVQKKSTTPFVYK